MILPYVYKLVHKTTGQFYFGSRWKNKVSSSNDLGILYFTSSKYVKPKFDEFDSMIIAEFFNWEDAYIFEQKLIHEHWDNPLKLNMKYHLNETKLWAKQSGGTLSQTHKESIGSALRGKKFTQEHKDNLSRALRGKPKKSTQDYTKRKFKPYDPAGKYNKKELDTPIGRFKCIRYFVKHLKTLGVTVSESTMRETFVISKHFTGRNPKFCSMFNISPDDWGKSISSKGFKILTDSQ